VPTETSAIVEIQAHDLLMKEKGTYEPATLTRAKHNTLSSMSNLSATSMASSPSASFDSHVRTGSESGMRRTQTTTSSQNGLAEPPTPSPGAKSAVAPGEFSPSLKDIHECFISAALGSIVYFLCHDHGFIPLNSRTLILTTPRLSPSNISLNNFMLTSNAITLATLDISLTSLGALVVKAYSDTAPGLQSLVSPSAPRVLSPDLSSGTALWLAPGGNAAKFYGTQDDKNLPGNLPISQLQKNPADSRQHAFNGATIQSWQTKCLDWLSGKGLNTSALEEGGWIFVQVLGSNSPYFNADYPGVPMLEGLAIVPWPALLCFQTSNNGARGLQPTSIKTASRDALSFAEDWFTGKDERAGILAKRQKERQIAEAKLREQADIEARNLQAATYSPAALRRGSNAGAMYPTPPDAPHHPVGVTPSFDGTVSTPGNPNPLFSQEVAATPQNTNTGTIDLDADGWSASGKKDRTNTGMDFNDNGNDNDLFGEELFGDVTDADFSFFDVPDAEEGDHGSAAPAQTAAPTAEEGNELMEASVLDSSTQAPPETTDIIMDDIEATTRITPDHERKLTEMQPPSTLKKNTATIEEKDDIKSEKVPAVSPPFNKEAIFNRLFAKSPEVHPRRASIFNKVEFEPSVLSVDKKYGANGCFNFDAEAKPVQKPDPLGIPKTEYLSRRRKVDNEQGSRSLARIIREPIEIVEPEEVDDEPMLYLLASELASQTSEQDDTSHTSEDRSMGLNPGVKRKWNAENEDRDEMA
jgi:mediator of RNA polymerase II transcription subunit 13